jgi:tetratricopeptide (TPR) repeat protein
VTHVDVVPLSDQLRALHEARDAAALVRLLEPVARADITSQPRIAFYLADSWRRVGRRQEALDLLVEAAPAFDRRGNDALHRLRLNLVGMICFDIGRIADAEHAWRTLLEDASDAGDGEHVARANQNLGAIYTLHVRTEEAIASYERAMAAYRMLGHRRGLAQCHHNLGLTYRELHFGPKADHHFLQAIRYAIAGDSEDEIARAEQERALLIYLERNDAPLARITVRRALDRFTAMAESAGIGEALRVLGLIELGEGLDEASRGHFRLALRQADATNNRLLEAETLEAVAVLEERDGDTETAHDLRNRAADLFAALGAPEWGRRERERVRRVAARGSR